MDAVEWDQALASASVSLVDLDYRPGLGLFFEDGWREDPDDEVAPAFY